MKPALDTTNFKGKLYLDAQPEFHKIIKDWIENLDIDDPYAVATTDEIECRARDGFIPFGHNLGGFDKTTWADLYALTDHSYGPKGLNVDKEIEEGYESALAAFKEDKAEFLLGVPDEKINYGDLYELGHPDLAEELSEYERAHLEGPVHWGVRAMYEGVDESGTHTLMVYLSASLDEYRGAFGKYSKTLGEFEITFKTVKQLQSKLKSLKKKVEAVI